MKILKRTQIINGPIDKVFETIIHLERYPAWNPTIAGAKKISGGQITNGSEFEFTIAGMGKTIQILEEFNLNKQVRLTPQSKMFSGGHRFKLSREGNATKVEHELEITPKGLFKLIGFMMIVMGKKNLRRTADALKNYVESSQRKT